MMINFSRQVKRTLKRITETYKIAIRTMPYKQILHYGCGLLGGWVCL